MASHQQHVSYKSLSLPFLSFPLSLPFSRFDVMTILLLLRTTIVVCEVEWLGCIVVFVFEIVIVLVIVVVIVAVVFVVFVVAVVVAAATAAMVAAAMVGQC